PEGIAVPAMMKGMVNSGSATSAPVLSTDWMAIAVAAQAPSMPALVSMLACSAVPVAPPPGVTRLNALPANWVLMIENQSREPSASDWTPHMQPKLATAHTSAGSIHSGCTSPSRLHAVNTSLMLGAKM